MAEKKKKAKPSGGLFDPGTVGGVAAAALVLAVWGAKEITISGTAAAERPAATDRVPPQPETAPAQPAAPPVAPKVDSPARMLTVWEQDPRWDQALTAGQSGLDLMVETRKWHEEVGGDPFRYRHQMANAKKLLEDSVKTLEAMKKSFADSPSAKTAIDQQLAKFSKPLGGLRKEAK